MTPRSLPALLFGSVGGLGFGIVLLVGLIFTNVALSVGQEALRLEREGVTAPGTVTALNQRTTACGKDNRSTCTAYDVTYRFAAQGVERTQTKAVSRSFFLGLEQGGRVEVRYVPGDPQTAEIEPGATRTTSWVLTAIAGGVSLIGGLGLLRRLRRVRQMRWLAIHGVPVEVRALRQDRTFMRINGGLRYRLVWHGPDGKEGGSEPWRQEDLPEPGATVILRTDPRGLFPPVWERDVLQP